MLRTPATSTSSVTLSPRWNPLHHRQVSIHSETRYCFFRTDIDSFVLVMLIWCFWSTTYIPITAQIFSFSNCGIRGLAYSFVCNLERVLTWRASLLSIEVYWPADEVMIEVCLCSCSSDMCLRKWYTDLKEATGKYIQMDRNNFWFSQRKWLINNSDNPNTLFFVYGFNQ